MKIVVLTRTRNEAKRIGLFCHSYEDADHIIVSDGGSEDATELIASQYTNVILSPFRERVEFPNGSWRNNDAAHVNHLIREAKKLDPAWVILDDVDCRPTRALKENYRSILEETDKEYVHVVRFYFWGKDQYFPDMSMPGHDNILEPSLWAWRGWINFEMIDVPPAYNFSIDGKWVKDLRMERPNLDLYPPHSLLHYSWDEERIEQKLRDYRDTGFIPGYNDPRNFAGQVLPKEDWMIE